MSPVITCHHLSSPVTLELSTTASRMLILSASKSLESHGACHGARGQCSAPELMWDIYIYINTTPRNPIHVRITTTQLEVLCSMFSGWFMIPFPKFPRIPTSSPPSPRTSWHRSGMWTPVRMANMKPITNLSKDDPRWTKPRSGKQIPQSLVAFSSFPLFRWPHMCLSVGSLPFCFVTSTRTGRTRGASWPY